MDMVQTLSTTSLILCLPTVHNFLLINMSFTYTRKGFPMFDGCISSYFYYYFCGPSLAEMKIEREVFHCLPGIFTILGGGSIREYHNCNSWRLEVLCLMYKFYLCF